MNKLYPLFFEPIYKQALWGGKKIRTKLERKVNLDLIAESWEISDRKEGQSIVTNGPLKGKSLHLLLKEYKQRLVGKNVAVTDFPLLIKIIDAQKPLSLQVHPDDKIAKILHEEAKTEMWVILEASPSSYIYANFAKKVTKKEFRQAIVGNTVEKLVYKTKVQKQDVIYIPGRTIHAIGQGCLLLEVQQNSNTTYRVYDWDRKDEKGNKRPLHIEKALQTIDFSRTHNPIIPPQLLEKTKEYSLYHLLKTPYFCIERLFLHSTYKKSYSTDSFHIFFCITGKVKITANQNTIELLKGKTVLIPAELTKITIESITSSSQLIRIFLPCHK